MGARVVFVQQYLKFGYDVINTSRAIRPTLAVLLFPLLVLAMIVAISVLVPFAFTRLEFIADMDFVMNAICAVVLLCACARVSAEFDRLRRVISGHLISQSALARSDIIFPLTYHLDRPIALQFLGFRLSYSKLSRVLYLSGSLMATLYTKMRR